MGSAHTTPAAFEKTGGERAGRDFWNRWRKRNPLPEAVKALQPL